MSNPEVKVVKMEILPYGDGMRRKPGQEPDLNITRSSR